MRFLHRPEKSDALPIVYQADWHNLLPWTKSNENHCLIPEEYFLVKMSKNAHQYDLILYKAMPKL